MNYETKQTYVEYRLWDVLQSTYPDELQSICYIEAPDGDETMCTVAVYLTDGDICMIDVSDACELADILYNVVVDLSDYMEGKL